MGLNIHSEMPRPLPTAVRVRMAAEATLAHMVREGVKQDIAQATRRGSLQSSSANLEQQAEGQLEIMGVQAFLHKVVEVTGNQCVYTCALTGLLLQQTGLFDQMCLVQSYAMKGDERSVYREFHFDTYLLLCEAQTGKYFAVSPPVSSIDDVQRNGELVVVHEASSVDEILNQMRDARPDLVFPNAREFSLHNYPVSSDRFYSYDPNDPYEEGPHTFATLKKMLGKSGMPTARPGVYRLATLDAFE